MAKLLSQLAAIPAYCRFSADRSRILGDVGMKKSEPDWIYSATIFAVALFTVCFIDPEQAKAWLDLFIEIWGLS